MQVNHTSNWDCSANYAETDNPWPKEYEWYFSDPKPWNSPENFTVNYLISSGRE
jgi:hypothetical protein